MPTIASLKSRLMQFSFNKLGIPKKINENFSKAYIRKFLPNNPVILDCGANDGWDTINLSRMTNNLVHAFEPVPELYQRLLQNTKNVSSIKCYPLALSDKNGFAEFYISEGASDASSSILPPKEHLLDHPEVLFRKKN